MEQSSKALAQQRYATIHKTRQDMLEGTQRARPQSPVRAQRAMGVPAPRPRPRTATVAQAARRNTAAGGARPATAGPGGRKPPHVDFAACVRINEEVNAGYQALKYEVHGTPPASPLLSTSLFAQGQFSPGSPLRPKSAVTRPGTAKSRVSQRQPGSGRISAPATQNPTVNRQGPPSESSGTAAPKPKVRPQTAGPRRRAGQRKVSICDYSLPST